MLAFESLERKECPPQRVLQPMMLLEEEAYRGAILCDGCVDTRNTIASLRLRKESP